MVNIYVTHTFLVFRALWGNTVVMTRSLPLESVQLTCKRREASYMSRGASMLIYKSGLFKNSAFCIIYNDLLNFDAISIIYIIPTSKSTLLFPLISLPRRNWYHWIHMHLPRIVYTSTIKYNYYFFHLLLHKWCHMIHTTHHAIPCFLYLQYIMESFPY